MNLLPADLDPTPAPDDDQAGLIRALKFAAVFAVIFYTAAWYVMRWALG